MANKVSMLIIPARISQIHQSFQRLNALDVFDLDRILGSSVESGPTLTDESTWTGTWPLATGSWVG